MALGIYCGYLVSDLTPEVKGLVKALLYPHSLSASHSSAATKQGWVNPILHLTGFGF